MRNPFTALLRLFKGKGSIKHELGMLGHHSHSPRGIKQHRHSLLRPMPKGNIAKLQAKEHRPGRLKNKTPTLFLPDRCIPDRDLQLEHQVDPLSTISFASAA